MAANRFGKTAIAQRRKQVAELYVQGWNQYAIAEKLGVTQPTICTELQRIQKEWE